MIKKIYGTMKKEEKKDYARLLALEVNSYLLKIYNKLKPKVKLAPQKVSASQFIMKHASFGATKMWEFIPKSRQEAARGDVGSIVVVTRGLEHNTVRKQRALLIAAEFYMYHSFANHHDPQLYSSVINQNQYLDVIKKLFGFTNAHELRDHAVRYVIEELEEHKTAHFSGDGWHTSLAKIKKHHPQISDALGSSEKVFKEILRKQDQKFDHNMLKQEDDLVRKELEDVEHIIRLLEDVKKSKHDAQLKKLINIHLENMKTFRISLKKVLDSLGDWILVDKKEHGELRKKLGLSVKNLHSLLLAEAEAEQIDINKVQIIFDFFKKEKINILRDLEMIDEFNAGKHPRRKH